MHTKNETMGLRTRSLVTTGVMGLLAGLFALSLTATPAQAAEQIGTDSIQKGGLIFTADNATGPTKVSISDPSTGATPNVITITGTGDPKNDIDITVTQQTVGTGLGLALQLEDYAGTLTLDNVNITASGGVPTIAFDDAGTPSGGSETGPYAPGTIVLTGGTKIGASSGQAAIDMQAYNNTLIIQGGSAVTGNGAAAITSSITTTNTTEPATIEFSEDGGTVIGGIGTVSPTAGTESGAITLTGDGTLDIEVNAAGIVNGANASADAATQIDAASALFYGTGGTGTINIEGSSTLTLTGGNGAAWKTKPGLADAAPAIQIPGTVNGANLNIYSDVNATGGNAANYTEAVAPESVPDGFQAILVSSSGGQSDVVTVYGGTVNFVGGNGGNTIANEMGGKGGNAVSINAGTLNVYGGAVNATGGIGGQGTPAVGATAESVAGPGGVGIFGNNASPEGALVVKYQPLEVGVEATPVVTAQGGLNGVKNKFNTALLDFGTAGSVDQITISSDAGRRQDPWLWLAMTKTANAGTLNSTANLAGFAGMDGASADSTKYGNLLVPNPNNVAWAQITTAPIESIGAAVNQYNSAGPAYNLPAKYVVAQTSANVDPNYTYNPTVTATFQGITNLNTSNFYSLSGLAAKSGSIFAPADNVANYSNSGVSSANPFYVKSTAEGNTLTLDLSGVANSNKELAQLYPNLTDELGQATIPVVYTVTLQAGPKGNPADTGEYALSGGPTTWNLYTNPDGSGNLVIGNNITGTVASAGAEATDIATTGTPTWTTLPAPAATVIPYTGSNQKISVADKTTSTIIGTANLNLQVRSGYTFIGYYDETATSAADWYQVPVTQTTGWNSNATLTAEWASSVVIGETVEPTPTQVEQGSSVNETATWTIKPVNTKLPSYSLGLSGINPDWKAQFIDIVTGEGTANGVTFTPGEFTTATELTNGAWTVSSTVAVNANATCDLGHYRVWPVFGNFPNVSATQGSYAVVEVIAASDRPTDNTINVIRMYNPNSGEHLFTTDANEAVTLEDMYGWDNENVAWVAPTSSGTPIYRLYNRYNGDHLYTTSLNEYNSLQTIGWRGEGIKLYSAPQTGAPIYRLYNPYMTANDGAYSHLWTGDYNEYITLWRQDGWDNESVAWYAISVPNPL